MAEAVRGGQAVQAPGHERGPEAGLRLGRLRGNKVEEFDGHRPVERRHGDGHPRLLSGAGLVPEGLAGLHAALRRGAVVRRAPHDERGQPRHRGVPGAGAGRHGAGLARGRRTYGKACSELDDRAHGARQQQGVHAAQQQQRAGRDRGRHQAGILRRRRPVRVGLHHHPLNPQQRDAAPHPRLRARLRGDDGGTHPTRTGPSAKVHQAGENGLRGAAGHAAEVPRQLGAARPQHVPRLFRVSHPRKAKGTFSPLT